MTRTSFERVAAFDPSDLPRSIERFEQSVRKKFVENDASPAANLYSIGLSVRTSLYAARFGELVRCDPTAAAFTVLLPRPDDPKADCIRIANIGTSTNTITLLPAFSDTFVNSTTSYLMTAPKQTIELYPDRFAKNWIVASDGQAVPPDVIISPASISTTQNSWAPVDATDPTKTWSTARIVRVTLGANVDITGADPNVSVTRKTIEVVSAGGNVQPFYMRLVRQSTAGISGGKLLVPYPNDAFVILSLPTEIVLDTASGGWRVE